MIRVIGIIKASETEKCCPVQERVFGIPEEFCGRNVPDERVLNDGDTQRKGQE